MCPSCVPKMPLWDAGGNYKKVLCRHLRETSARLFVPMCVLYVNFPEVYNKSRLGLRGGCGPCRHKIKEHKSNGMGGRVNGGNCGSTSLSCFILQLRGSADGYSGISTERSAAARHRSIRTPSSLSLGALNHTAGTMSAGDLGCGFLYSHRCLSLT